jgi:hypothetical protein
LFRCQRTDKRQAFVCTRANGFRKIVFRLILSMSPISMFPSLHGVSMSPRLHGSTSPCFHVSIYMSLCFNVHVSMFPDIRKRETGLTENGTNGKRQIKFVFYKRKRQTSVRLVQTETEDFCLLGRQMINDNRRLLLEKRAHLCVTDNDCTVHVPVRIPSDKTRPNRRITSLSASILLQDSFIISL